ncbi:iron ABC transporter permease [Pseudonocardiaceae bacterium YIM PH 21723]|nr:iron ABC transporter permease [Pseudonocardiaceae bacterium YIM PH 21723]
MKAWRLVAALVLLCVVAVVGMGIGARHVPAGEVVRALLAYNGSPDHIVVLDLRGPRAVLAIAVGAALAVAGVLIQTITRNPLGEPGILGVTAGSSFAVVVGSVLGVSSQYSDLLLAIVGAAVASVLVYSVGRVSPLRLVLTGSALTFVLSGCTTGLQLLFPHALDKYRYWHVGSLAGREQQPNLVPLLVIAVSLVGALLISRQLNAVALGDTVAQTLGAKVQRVRFAALVLVTVLSGAATALAGPILFVGLMVPHLARQLAGASVGWMIGFAAVLGPVLLLIADIGSRVLLPTGEVPVAIVMAFLGGPVLIWAARRYGRVEA